MSDTLSGLLTIGTLVVLLALVHVPLGDHMARVYTDTRHLRVERAVYRLTGVAPDAEQSTRGYVLSLLAFTVAGTAVLLALLLGQSALPWDRGLPGMPWDMALNTAVSFVTNTNWQSYGGESTLGVAAQTAGLAVQNVLSAAVGMAVAVALVRGFTRSGSSTLGNFWVDLVRGVGRSLLPLSLVAAIVLLLLGVVQNVSDVTVRTLAGDQQMIPGGLAASQEAIKLLGTNGGGYFNANSAHPFENPTALSNLLQVLLMLLIPVSLTRTLGTLVGNRRQGVTVLAAMGVLWVVSLAVTTWAEVGGQGLAGQAAGAAMEGKETRFGEWASALFAVSTTGTSTGAVNAAHDSFSPLGGGAVLVNMMLGEVSPGGVGSGLYGILVISVLAVFVAGLMVGRTPELLGKKIGTREMTFVALYVLVTPALVLVGIGIAITLPVTAGAMGNPGGHGFTEVVYAFTSAANNNGSAFGGLTVTSMFFQVALAVAMLLGRIVPMLLVLLLAGSLARQRTVPRTVGTLPTDTLLFAGLVVGVVVLVSALTYFPTLALGPVAEALTGASR